MHGGQPDAVEVAEHLLHRPLGVGERPVRSQRVERVPRRSVLLDEAVPGHPYALALEEALAQRVGDGGAVERDVDVDRMAWGSGVELGERGQAVLDELPRLQAADRGDEGAFGHALRALADDGLRVGDRVGGFDRAGLVARAAAHELHVEVVVDHSRNDRAAAQIDRVGAAARCAGAVTNLDESAVGHADLRHDGPLRVHRVDAAVGQEQQPSTGTRRRLSTAGHAADHQRGGNPRHHESGSEVWHGRDSSVPDQKFATKPRHAGEDLVGGPASRTDPWRSAVPIRGGRRSRQR